ncbi:hypothetical protein D9M69_518740 [compost metagenome]
MPGKEPMKDLHEKLEEATVRMSQIILLAGMLNDGDALPDPLRDLLEEEDDKTLRECFPDMPAAMLDDRESEELFREDFACWAHQAGKLGFVIQFDRPVMRYAADGRSAGYSWGLYAQHWAYGDTLDEVVAKGLEWAYKREASEKAKAAQPNAQTTGA